MLYERYAAYDYFLGGWWFGCGGYGGDGDYDFTELCGRAYGGFGDDDGEWKRVYFAAYGYFYGVESDDGAECCGGDYAGGGDE